MKTHKIVRMLVEKAFWDFCRPEEFFEEGSYAIDHTLETKRAKVIFKLLKENNLRPTPKMAKIVDFCVFMTKNIVDTEEHSYMLYLAIANKFSNNLNYNKLLARREIEKLNRYYSLKHQNSSFTIDFNRKMLGDDYTTYEKALKYVNKYVNSIISERKLTMRLKFRSNTITNFMG